MSCLLVGTSISISIAVFQSTKWISQIRNNGLLVIQGFPIELKTSGHFDEYAGVYRKTAERNLKTSTTPGSADLYRKIAAHFLGILSHTPLQSQFSQLAHFTNTCAKALTMLLDGAGFIVDCASLVKPLWSLLWPLDSCNRVKVLDYLRSVRNRSWSHAFVCQSVIPSLNADTSTPSCLLNVGLPLYLADSLKRFYGLGRSCLCI